MNITEDYVSFEVAKLLNEKGFDEKTLSYYEDNVLCRGDWFEWNRSPLGHIAAPTHQMAMKWLREKHIVIVILPNDFDVIGECWGWRCNVYNKGVLKQIPYDFPLYEEAAEAALKYCLENLENLI